MKWLWLAAALLAGGLATMLVTGVFYAFGNAFILWSGWTVLAPLIGAFCGCYVTAWIWATRRRVSS